MIALLAGFLPALIAPAALHLSPAVAPLPARTCAPIMRYGGRDYYDRDPYYNDYDRGRSYEGFGRDGNYGDRGRGYYDDRRRGPYDYSRDNYDRRRDDYGDYRRDERYGNSRYEDSRDRASRAAYAAREAADAAREASRAAQQASRGGYDGYDEPYYNDGPDLRYQRDRYMTHARPTAPRMPQNGFRTGGKEHTVGSVGRSTTNYHPY